MIEQLTSFIIITRISDFLPFMMTWILQILFANIIVEFNFCKAENFVVTFNAIASK